MYDCDTDYKTQEELRRYCRKRIRDYLSRLLTSVEKQSLDPYGVHKLTFCLSFPGLGLPDFPETEYSIYSDYIDVLRHITDRIKETAAEGLFKDDDGTLILVLVNADNKILVDLFISPVEVTDNLELQSRVIDMIKKQK